MAPINRQAFTPNPLDWVNTVGLFGDIRRFSKVRRRTVVIWPESRDLFKVPAASKKMALGMR